jgi:acyl carrier protein
LKQVTKEDIINIIKNLDLDIDDIENIDTSIPLAEQGFDSLDMMNIYFDLEENFSIKISEEALETQNWFIVDSIVQNINMLIEP